MRRVVIAALAVLGLTGCSLGTPAETPLGLSADDVISTAQVAAAQTRQAATPTPSQTPVPPTATMPRETATATTAPTTIEPIVTANETANVRSGPSADYEWIDFLYQGQSAYVVGRYENAETGTWWYVRRIGGGLDGWVWGQVVTLSGSEALIPFLEPSPVPPQ